MKKPLIAIDIDDTIADSTESLRIVANERTGFNVPSEAYKVKGEYWGYYERVWKEHGINEKYSFADHMEEMQQDQSSVLLVNGASEAIGTLTQHYRVLITSRDVSWERATRHWLSQHFTDLEYELYFSNNHRDASSFTKGELCKKLGAEILIDDNDDHCQSALEAGLGAIRFGSYGWHGEENANIPGCRTWKDILEYLGV